MTVIRAHEIHDRLAWFPGSYENGESFAGIEIRRFTEDTYPEGAIEAQRVQAESYLDKGYVLESAIDTDGRLAADIDSSRGGDNTYYLALDQDGAVLASLRLGDIPEGESIESLSSYRHTKDVLYQDSKDFLEALVEAKEAGGPEVIRDCSAICKRKDAPVIASYAVIRDAIRQSLRSDKNEVWVMAVTTEAFGAFKDAFGKAIWRTGDNIPPIEGDARISESTKLIPAMSDVRMVPQNILESIEESDDDISRQKYIRSLNLLCAGLSDEELSDDETVVKKVRAYLQE